MKEPNDVLDSCKTIRNEPFFEEESQNFQPRSELQPDLHTGALFDQGFQEIVLTTLINLENVKDIKNSLIIRNPVDISTEKEIPPLPCKTREEVEQLNEWLQDDENKQILTRVLVLVGGRRFDNLVRKCLAKLFAPDLARKINYAGQKQKLEFQKLHLNSIINMHFLRGVLCAKQHPLIQRWQCAVIQASGRTCSFYVWAVRTYPYICPAVPTGT
ncbi:unnamed protein product [Allacma fusca]|uniref:DUF4806 domain-containing protein n=1 Tax=Allacma fusca TaxID=39272 RepID=A0A8J2PPH3_9HEXA|nr:unnamed protein product [Allacma fusca]